MNMMKHIVNNKENRKEFIEMLKTVSLYINNVREALCAPYGLSSIQAVIVLDIYHNPNECRVTDICKRLNKSTNTISPLINRLGIIAGKIVGSFSESSKFNAKLIVSLLISFSIKSAILDKRHSV